MFKQADLGPHQHKNNIEQPMKVPGGFPSLLELHSLLVNEINHIEITPMRESKTKGIIKTLAEVFGLGLHAANTQNKKFSFPLHGAGSI